MKFFRQILKRAEPENLYNLSLASKGLTVHILTEYNRQRFRGPQPILCYAPLKNIYFGHQGYATACCYNRDYHLGRYPDQTVKEIWFGERTRQLREYISVNNLSYGCQGCLSHLVNANYDSVKAKQYDDQPLHPGGYPSVMEFELDNTCNLECVMCNGDFSSLIRANREKRQPVKDPYDSKFVEQLEEFIPHLHEIKFYGGEPFLIELYYDIIALVIRLNPAIKISIQTNATVLNNRVRTILSKANVHLNLSIDSLKKETYEAIRINANYERVMENLQYFHQYAKEKNTNLVISTCLMQQNWNESVDIVRFCNQLNVTCHFHSVIFPTYCTLRTLPGNQLWKIYEWLNSELPALPESNPVERLNKHHFSGIVSQVKGWHDEALRSNGTASVQNMEDFIAYVNNTVKQFNGLEADHYTQKKDVIIEKLEEVKRRLPADFDYSVKLRAIDFENPLLIDVLIKKSTDDVLAFFMTQ